MSWFSVNEGRPEYGHVVLVWSPLEGLRLAFLDTGEDGAFWSVMHSYEGIDYKGSYWHPIPETPCDA